MLLSVLVFSSCDLLRKVTADDLLGVYHTETPDGEFLLVAPDDGYLYCIVCKDDRTDSIPVTIDDEEVKDESGNTLAILDIKDEKIKAVLPVLSDDERSYVLRHKELVKNDMPAPPVYPVRYIDPLVSPELVDTYVKPYNYAEGFYDSNPTDKTPNTSIGEYFDSALQKYELFTRDLTLEMDIYAIPNDTVAHRPAILLLHGGAFLFGDKAGDFMSKLARYYASRGYVVASANYRLGCSLLGVASVYRTIYRAVQDAGVAKNFLIRYADDFGIDPNALFVVGHSAGAIAALTSAVMTNDEAYEDISAIPPFRSYLGPLPAPVNVLGTVGLWGAVTDLNLIDTEDRPDFLLIHGSSDEIVPFRSGIPFESRVAMFGPFLSSFFSLYGSGNIYDHMQLLGLPCEMYVFDGLNHDPHLNADGSYNENLDVVFDKITHYLYSRLDKLCPPIEEIHSDSYATSYRISRGSPVKQVAWSIQGGLIFDKVTDNEVVCYRFSNAPSYQVTASVQLENGKTTVLKLSE